MLIPNIIMLVFAAGFLVVFGYVTIISLLEKESRAARIAGLCSIVLPAIYIAAVLIDYPYHNLIVWILSGLTAAGGVVLLLPARGRPDGEDDTPTVQIDERDTMFSRGELDLNPARFTEYYERRPEQLKADNKFRARPGLLSEKAKYYDPFQFNSALASFSTVKAFHPMLDSSSVNEEPVKLDPSGVSVYLKWWAKKLGAAAAGIAELRDYHLYSVLGRAERYGQPSNLNHHYALAVTVEMDKGMMDMAPQGPTVMESAQQYLEAGMIAVQVAAFIKALGYSARAHIDGNYHVVCPLVARDAGLGEIGRMGLLMTPELGPRVRIAVVTTDMPLEPEPVSRQPAMIDFCAICKKCADSCPPQAIPFEDRIDIDGVKRWQIESEECFTYWCTTGTDCGRCISVCPFSHPDNLFHRLIRRGVYRSAVFRKFALKMDNIFYGRKPPPAGVPVWMKAAGP